MYINLINLIIIIYNKYLRSGDRRLLILECCELESLGLGDLALLGVALGAVGVSNLEMRITNESCNERYKMITKSGLKYKCNIDNCKLIILINYKFVKVGISI